MKYKGIRGNEQEVWKTKVKYYGVFHLRTLYKELMEFLKDLEYTDEERYKYFERFYFESRSLDPRQATQMWIWIRTDKTEGPVDESSYYRYYLDVDYHVRFMKDVEIMKEGEKMKVQHGEVEISIRCGVELDWNGKWQNHWFLKNMHDFFLKRLWWKQYQDKRHIVKDDALKLQRFIKEYFELQSYLPLAGKPFIPSHGYKEEAAAPG
ncbi:hypothetical protein HYS48_03680 [Candidatus Woesearchaeota archaeon]|nr:hypothetical protein [Candidatus Woesearchaeota archaeon]